MRKLRHNPRHRKRPLSIGKLRMLIVLIVGGSTLIANRCETAESQRRRVQWVVDGDTFKVCPDTLDGCDRDEQISIRVKGLDCPENRESNCHNKPNPDCKELIPEGRKAKHTAIQTLKKEVVTLEPTGLLGQFETGGKGRQLAYVRMEDGTDYGLEMIKEGLCRDNDYRPHDRSDEYQAAEQE